jgi:uncharacterized protein (DUF433 family)
MAAATAYAHIELHDSVPYVAGTRMKVEQLALDEIAFGWDAAEIQRQHPELTLAQVHSALAYYHDHREHIDERLRERERVANEVFQQRDDTPAVKERLRARGRLG